MGKYGGTVLTGQDNFTLWQTNLEIELAAVRLKKFLRHDKCITPTRQNLKNTRSNDDDNFENELEEWEFQHAQALKIILQSVDNTNRVIIQSCQTASSAYETLVKRYNMKNTARLAQLLSQLFSIQFMKEVDVVEKYDLIINLCSQITDQQPDASISEIVQAVILMRSLPSEFDTTLEILTNKNTFPTLEDVFQAAKSTETRLADPEISTELQIANSVSKPLRNRLKVCWVCQGNHVKSSCPKWLATQEGSDFKKSGLKWHQWRVSKNNSQGANAVNLKNEVVDCNPVSSFDNDSEFEKSTYLCAAANSDPKLNWGLDTMCSCHLTPRKDAFVGKIMPTRVAIEVADGTTIYSEGKGDVRIFWKSSTSSHLLRSTILRGVLYVPDASISLISLGALVEKGVIWNCDSSALSIWSKDKCLLFRGILSNRVWMIPNHKEYAGSSMTKADLLHKRFGHPGEYITKRIKKAVTGVPPSENLHHKFCVSCTEAKMTRNVSREPMRRVTRILERVHMDLCGPFRTRSWHGNIYMLTITDQFTLFKWAIFRNQKKDLVNDIKKWCIRVENERRLFGKDETLQAIRIDRGTEFLNNEMKSWASNKNISLESTIGYHPEANGIAERSNRTIIEKGNSLRFHAGLPSEYWEFSFRTAVYLGNRLPIGNRDITPWTAWYGTPPDITHYRIWGCVAYVHIPKKQRGKLDKRCWSGIFVGYKTTTTKIYYIWHPKKKQLFEAQSVHFDETSFDNNANPSLTNRLKNVNHFELEDIETSTLNCPADNDSNKIRDSSMTPDNALLSNTEAGPNLSRTNPTLKTRESRPRQTETVLLETRRSDRIRNMFAKNDDLISNRQRSNAAIELAYSTAHANHIDVPATYEDALQTEQAEKWIEAYQSEMKSLVENSTFSAPLDNIPDSKIAVTAKIVLDLKRGENNEIIRYKARLVARGFTQKYGVNYEETFAPTIRLDAIRIILAIAAKENWEIYQMDVVTAFLAGDLEDEVYMKMPEHMVQQFGRYTRVLKSLYGLKQAARVWYLLLANFLTSIGFTCVPTDQTIFINSITGVVIGIHVDDLLITGPNKNEAEKLKESLKVRFKMKDLGLARNVLGMRITRKGKYLTLDQSQYAQSIVRDFAMPGTKIYLSPMASNAIGELEKSPGRICTDEELSGYWRLLGKLMYLCNSRPDIIFATHKLAQYSHKACHNHWLALLRVLSYVEGTVNYGIRYGGESKQISYYKVDSNIEVHCGTSKAIDMVTFADADYAGDISDRKSITGAIMMLNGGAVATICKKQTCVATSTTNAEYIAASEGAKLALWGKMLISKILGSYKDPIPLLLGDNKACVQLQGGISNTSKIKHIDVGYHHVLDEIRNRKLESRWVSGRDMLADGLTKPLTGPLFYEKRAEIGVCLTLTH